MGERRWSGFSLHRLPARDWGGFLQRSIRCAVVVPSPPTLKLSVREPRQIYHTYWARGHFTTTVLQHHDSYVLLGLT